MHHCLKTHPKYFVDVIDGRKAFDVRRNDRDFKEGDTVILQEYDTVSGYTGREEVRQVDRVYTNLPEGLEKGFCVLALQEPMAGDW